MLWCVVLRSSKKSLKKTPNTEDGSGWVDLWGAAAKAMIRTREQKAGARRQKSSWALLAPTR